MFRKKLSLLFLLLINVIAYGQDKPGNSTLTTIYCEDDKAVICIDGERKGIKVWTGYVEEGAHQIEARKDLCHSSFLNVTVQHSRDTSFHLKKPVPFSGKLMVNSTPLGADVILNGKKVSITPAEINDLTIGKYEMKVRRFGYYTVNQQIEIFKDSTSYYDVLLSNENAKAQKAKSEADAGLVQESKFLITVNAAISPQKKWSFGFRIGTVKRWGWNVSVMYNFNQYAFSAQIPAEGGKYDFDQKVTSRLGITAGGMFYPHKNVLIFLNAGYGYRGVCNHLRGSENRYFLDKPNTLNGIECSTGIVTTFGGFALSFEAVTVNFKYVEFKFGIGGLFRTQR